MSEPVRSYQDLTVWQDGLELAASLYELTRSFPREEIYGLTTQIRRSSASIPANIAEGHGRELTPSFIQFLRVAQGSLKELETHLYLAERVGLLKRELMDEQLTKCASLGKRLRALIRSLQDKIGQQE
jgi:four helix bundle protein